MSDLVTEKDKDVFKNRVIDHVRPIMWSAFFSGRTGGMTKNEAAQEIIRELMQVMNELLMVPESIDWQKNGN
ncbi:MAG TPA: hypothetical protein VGK47_04520 [Nitrososphaeraceae archaeon]